MRPLPERDQAKLLVYDQARDEVIHSHFSQLHQFLPEQSALFFNQSKVLPCRLWARKETGGRVEVFFLSHLSDEQGRFQVLLKSSGKKRVGEELILPEERRFRLCELGESGTFYLNCLKGEVDLESYLFRVGKIPIPPYIRQGQSDEQDNEDYQTVFSKQLGSVAAPTAGLHFTPNLIETLKSSGHQLLWTTLHVGLGTFKPLTHQELESRKLHRERFCLGSDVFNALKSDRYKIAVGTTTLRALESSLQDPSFTADQAESWRETDIFLHPGIDIESVDGLLTNFHLPESSLLMLVSAFIGREKVLALYEEAIKKQYRFFSYGDGMLIKRAPKESRR